MKKNELSLLLMSAFVLVGCGGKTSSSDITISIWEDVNNHEMIETLLETYVATYKEKYPLAPNLKFTLIEEKESKAVSDLSLQGPSGQGPDIFAFVHDTLSSAVTNNLIAENIFSEEIRANHSSDAVQAFTYNNKMYGYPITAESQTLMYDKRQLTASDVTSLENILSKGKKIVLDVADTDSSGYYTYSYMSDADLFGPEGKNPNSLNLATPQAVANLTALTKDLRGAIVKGTPDDALTIMSTGEASGVITAPYLWSLFQESVGTANAGIAVLPTINGNNARPFSGFKGYGVSRYAKNPLIAHDVARYLIDEFAQRYRFAQKGILPTFESDIVEDEISSDTVASVFQTALNGSQVMPNITQMGSFWAPMNDAVTEIWTLSSPTQAKVQEILTTTTTTIKQSI